MFDVAVVGSANLDLVATTERLPSPGETVLGIDYAEHPGGKGLNQAIAAARCGAQVSYVGAFGDDAAGGALRTVASHEGVDLSGSVTVADAPTGRALISVEQAGENSIIVVPGANAILDDRIELPPARVVLAQLEVPEPAVIAAFREARASGRPTLTVLNPAPAPPDGIADELLALCDVLIPNEHELQLLGGSEALLARGVRTVVTTRGAAGVTVHAAGEDPWDLPAVAVDPVDTTGAGDAFCGALACRLASGEALNAAVRYAAAAGALATTRPGAVPSLPRHDAISALLG